MAGSPGSGKTLLARSLPGILPEMSIEESLDLPRIYSVADQLSAGTPLLERLSKQNALLPNIPAPVILAPGYWHERDVR
jgi:predicted ATPase with chaperone activity